jgi:hypothetical protein
MMKGVGGFAALSMSNTTIAEAADIMQEQEVPTDPHTLDTYRSIVDAIVPRTPELADEEGFGFEDIAGGLDVELEKFIVYDFNHFQEIRLETLQTPAESGAPEAPSGVPEAPGGVPGTSASLPDRLGEMLGGSSTDSAPDVTDTVSDVAGGGLDPEARMPLDLFETTLDTTGSGTDLDAVLDLVDEGVLSELTDSLDLDGLAEFTDFGALDTLDISIPNAPAAPDASGPADVELLVEAGNQTVHRVQQNYTYAEVFPVVFDIAAAEFLLRRKNEDTPSPNEQFPGGGTFTKLSREDRLRVLWEIVDGGFIDRADELLSPMLPAVGILKYVIMAVNGLHGFGYYTEWSAYGDTKTDLPQERELARPASEAQSRTQTGYPGPADGYAADWFHAVDGGFADPPAQSLNYEQKDTDLTGEDVLSEDQLTGGDDAGSDGGSDDNPLPESPVDEAPDGDDVGDALPGDDITDGVTDGVTDDATDGLGGDVL